MVDARKSAVWLFARTKPRKSGAPVVGHLINHSYDEATNTIHAQSDMTVRLRPELLGGKKVSRVTLFTADGEQTAFSFDTRADGIHDEVPELELRASFRLRQNPNAEKHPIGDIHGLARPGRHIAI